MSLTTKLAEAADQVQQFWSPLFVPELIEQSLLPALINKDYEGDIKKGGDTVRVSQILRPNAVRKNIDTDPNPSSFDSQLLTTTKVDVKADTRITASYEIEDLVELQSQLGDKDSEIRQSLVESIMIDLNSYIYSLVAPSASAPDHTKTGVTDFNAAEVNELRQLASQAKWPGNRGSRYLLTDPSYMSDMLNNSTLTSADFGAQDAPVIGGQMARQRFGFNIFEDNSAGMGSLSSSGADAALAFHPDFMYLVMQRAPTFKVSDLHANKQHGFLISVDMILGAKIGIEGDVKHMTVINS